jgi:hypothetical protein
VLRELPVGVVAGTVSQDAYLARSVPSYRAWQYINASLPPATRVLTFSGGDHLYSARPRIWSDSTTARHIAWNPARSEEQSLREVERLGVTHILVDKRLLEDDVTGPPALVTARMRACCLAPVYEDGRFAVYAVRRATVDAGSAVSRR